MSTMTIFNSFSKILIPFLFLVASAPAQGQDLITASINTPGSAGILAESCSGPYELVIRRAAGNDQFTEIYISGSGSATIGVDYELDGPFPVMMAASDSVVVVPIIVINDGLVEGLESVILELAALAGIDDHVINVETAIADAYEVEIESPTDTIQWCRDASFVLLANSNADEIYWTPAGLFEDSLGTSATIRPFNSGWVYASVGDANCGAKDSVYFDLAIVDILNDDTVYICLDNDTMLLGSISGLATSFEWIPSDSTLSDPNILNPIVSPTVTTTYILQSDIGVCTARDRVVVRVDSLPSNLDITVVLDKPFYCFGEEVVLFSPSFDSLDYPDIMFNWLPNNGSFTSPLDILNAHLILLDTTLYIREVKNNACVSFNTKLLNVVPPTVPLSVMDTTLCPGETFSVEVLADMIMNPMWDPVEGLSNPMSTITNVTVLGVPGEDFIYQFSGTINECPVGATLRIRIPPFKPIIIQGAQLVCEGKTIDLSIADATGLSNFNWEVLNGNATFSCNNCPNPSVTVNSDETLTILVTADTDDDQFCGAIDTITLQTGFQPQLSSVFTGCIGSTIVVNTGFPHFTDVMWSVIPGEMDITISNTEGPTTTVTVNGNGKLRFTAEVPNSDTCRVTGIIDIQIPFDDNNTIFLTPMGEIGQGSSVMAMLTGNQIPSSAMWTVNGTPQSSTGTSIEFLATEELNLVEVKYINSKGCEQIDTITFPTVPPVYHVPNAFTPNNDGNNDKFRIIINGNIFLDELLIFNRWGQLVYEAPQNDMDGWDGRFKNENAASDTYVYKATLRYPDGRQEQLKGDVALLR